MKTVNSVWIVDPFAESFLRMFRERGWTAYIIPSYSCETFFREVVRGTVTAVLFTGGSDISPSQYRTEKDVTTGPCDKTRDFRELELLASLPSEILKLGVCRGFQLLHVRNKGILNQHINGHSMTKHKVYDYTTEILFGDVDTQVLVSCDHHQCIKNDIDNIRILAEHEDGTIEAGYYPKSNSLGVQFHPEWGPKESEDYFFRLIDLALAKGL